MSRKYIAVYVLQLSAIIVAFAALNDTCLGREGMELAVVERAKSPHVQGPFVIPVKIGNVKYQFMVDTGCTRTLVDMSLLPVIQDPDVTRPKFGETIQVSNVTVSIAENDYRLAEVTCRDLSSVRVGTCIEIRGIVGMDILSRHILQFDAISRSLTIATDLPDVAGFDSVDIAVVKNVRPYVPLLVQGVSVLCVLDTGSAGGIRLEQQSFEKVIEKLGSKPQYAPATVGTIDGAVMGEFSFPATVAVAPTLSLDNIRITKSPRVPTVGNLFLCRFDWICDFPSKKLYLRRGALFNGHEFTDRGGMTIEHTQLGVFVIAVAADSIADRAGVLPGDEIRAVRSFDAQVHGGKVLVKELVSPQLDDVKLVMRRNGEVVNATLRIAR